MAKVSTYLNFPGNTEEAFNFYKSVFRTEFVGEIGRMRDVPQDPGQPEMSEAEKNMIMHMELPIVNGHLLMGTDVVPSMGLEYKQGNNVTICIQPDSRAELDRLYKGLSAGAEAEMEPREMFWGDYYTSFVDKFGISWMITTDAKE